MGEHAPSRRDFLLQSGAAAAALASELFGRPQNLLAAPPAGEWKPPAGLKALADVALNQARKLGASYADIRINRYRDERVGLRSAPELGSGKVNHVPLVFESHSFGLGVRVLANGAWGFAASHLVSKDEIARVVGEAVGVAKANSVARKSPVRLAPVKPATDRWSTPFKQNPFEVPISDKLALLRSANENARKVKGVFMVASNMSFHGEDKFFASTDGSYIQQYIVLSYPSLAATARDFQKRISRSRSYVPLAVNGGYEHVLAADIPGHAERTGEEVMEHLAAPPVTPGKKDLVLLPNNEITTAGLTRDMRIGISSTREARTGSVAVNELDDEALKRAVARSEELASFAPPDPEYVPPLGPQEYAEIPAFDEITARARSRELLPGVQAVISEAAAKKLNATGFFTRTASSTAFGNRRGNFGYHRRTSASYSATVRTPDGTGSGWAEDEGPRLSDIDPRGLGARAIEKAVLSQKPRRLEPGKYTVVLEPHAVADLAPRMKAADFNFASVSDAV